MRRASSTTGARGSSPGSRGSRCPRSRTTRSSGSSVQSQRDLGSLRIFDPTHPDRAVVAAGAPWFMALFGRDSLLTALMSLPVDPTLALGTLRTLADLQGTEWIRPPRSSPVASSTRCGSGPRRTSRSAAARSTTARPTRRPSSSWCSASSPAGAACPRMPTTSSRPPIGRSSGSCATATATATASSSTSGSTISASSTRAGRTRGTASTSPTGRSPKRPSRSARCRATRTRRILARGLLAAIRGDEHGGRNGTRGRTTLKRGSTSGSGCPDRGYFAHRPRPRQAARRFVRLEHGPLPVERHRRRRQSGRRSRERLMSRRDVHRMGRAHPGIGHGRVQPRELPQRVGLAPRQRDRRRGLMRYGFVEEAQRIVVGAVRGGERASAADCPSCSADSTRTNTPSPSSYPASCSPQAWAAATPFSLLRTMLRFDPSVPTRRGLARADPAAGVRRHPSAERAVRRIPDLGRRLARHAPRSSACRPA